MRIPFRRKKPDYYYEIMYLKGLVEELAGYLKKISAGEDLKPEEISHFHLLVDEVSRLSSPYDITICALTTIDLLLSIKSGEFGPLFPS